MKKEMCTSRIGFRDGLVALAEKDERIVFVSTDSIKVVKGEKFMERWPERFIEVGIAEQNGVAVCAGLASSELIPYICTYAGFLTMRACEQMRTFVAYPKLKVRFIGVNGGIYGGNREGVTHQFIEDIGILRTIPGFTIVCPADENQVKKAIIATADVEGPVYIRLGSGKEEKVFSPETPFELGKAQIIHHYGDDVALLCNGFVTNRVIEAAQKLEEEGIHATVVEVATVKPLDETTIGRVLGRCKCAVTVEDHSVIGGLGSAIAEFACATIPTPLERLGLQDCYGESGFPDELLDTYGMSVSSIMESARKAISRNTN